MDAIKLEKLSVHLKYQSYIAQTANEAGQILNAVNEKMIQIEIKSKAALSKCHKCLHEIRTLGETDTYDLTVLLDEIEKLIEK